MKEKHIILKLTSHPELTELRESDPEKYQELSQQIVESRFAELLSIFKRWQKNRISMTMYEISLCSIESQLDGLDYSLYDAIIDGKRRLTQKFYEKCMCYSVDKIIEAASKRSDYDLKIYRILELVRHTQSNTDYDEFGFLFTVKEHRSYSWIIYENVSDDSRASILFQVRPTDFERAIEVIRTFFASTEENKRQSLAQSTIRFKSPAILSYRRIHHHSLTDWRLSLASLLRSR